MISVTTVTEKGQVAIPVRLRRSLGLTKGKKVRFGFHEIYKGVLVMRPVEDLVSLRGVFKSEKKYSKKKAREEFIKDVVKGKV